MAEPVSTQPLHSRPSFFKSFRRSQASNSVTAVVDLGTFYLLSQAFGVWYVTATSIGAFLGAITNFMLGRYWAFKASHRNAYKQLAKYAVVSGTSLTLNTVGVYLFTDYYHLHSAASRPLVAILVSLLFNFPLQRGFVFR